MRLSEKDKKFLFENKTPTYMYRVQHYSIKSIDDEYGFALSRVQIHHFKYEVISYTKKGVWIRTGFGKKRFILLSAKKKFAHDTLEKAYISFIRRKEVERRIYSERIKEVNIAIALASTELKKAQTTPAEE